MVTLRGTASCGPAETQEQNLSVVADGPEGKRWDQRLPVLQNCFPLHADVKHTCRIDAPQPVPEHPAALAVGSFPTFKKEEAKHQAAGRQGQVWEPESRRKTTEAAKERSTSSRHRSPVQNQGPPRRTSEAVRRFQVGPWLDGRCRKLLTKTGNL